MKSIIKDWYTGENIPGGDAPARLQTNSARWRGKRRTESRFTATFSRSQNELYEALCDREEFAGLHRATAIFAQGVGSACVWLSRLWDEKRKAPFTPAKGCP